VKSYEDALGRDPVSDDALSGLMNAYLLQKQTDKAIAAANAQIAKTPASSAFYDLLGTVLFNNKHDLGAAEAALRKSCELDKNNTDALVKLGQVLAAKSSPDEAIGLYHQYLQEHPDVGFYVLSGELYEGKRDWNNAKQMYQKALDLTPDHPVAASHLASVLVESGGNLETALSLAQTARRAMPDFAPAADTLGRVYYQKGLYKPAIEAFQDALKLGGDDAAVHFHLALAYQKTGQPGLVRQHLEQVLKIDPNFGSAGEVKRLLAQLQ